MGYSFNCYLKSQFFDINGQEDTTLVLWQGNAINIESIQILHVNGNHWITISTLDFVNSNSDVTIYDSLHFLKQGYKKRYLLLYLKPKFYSQV